MAGYQHQRPNLGDETAILQRMTISNSSCLWSILKSSWQLTALNSTNYTKTDCFKSCLRLISRDAISTEPLAHGHLI